MVATGDPSCTDPPDNSNPDKDSGAAVCAFITAKGLQGVAFDPRPGSTIPTPILQTLYAGVSFGGNPGCGSIMDGNAAGGTNFDVTGDALCAIQSSANTLQGFAFNPRTQLQSNLQTLGTSVVVGTPSCSGLADHTNEVICGVRSSANIINDIKFDPRANVETVVSNGLASASDLSCTFQNNNPGQLSCASVVSGQNQLMAIILSPLYGGVKAVIPALLL